MAKRLIVNFVFGKQLLLSLIVAVLFLGAGNPYLPLWEHLPD